MKARNWSGVIAIIALLFVMGGCGGGPAFTAVSNNDGDSLEPEMVADSEGGLHLAWVDLSPGRYVAFYSAKTDGSWSAPLDISRSENFATVPAIAVDRNGAVHAAWYGASDTGEDIFYSFKTKGGNWSEPENVSSNAGDSENPSIAVDSDGTVHLAWQDRAPGSNSIFYSSKAAGGAWSEFANASNTTASTANPAIVADSQGNLHLVWQQEDGGVEDVFYATMPKGGAWSAPENFSNNPGASQSPAIGVDSKGTPHVTWFDNSIGNWETFYSARGQTGSWLTPENVSKTSGTSGFSQIVVDDKDAIHLVWHDDTPGNFDIFYVKKVNGGSWSGSKNITGDAANSADPAVAVDREGVVHIAWTDYSKGNWDIFYTSLQP